MTDKKRRRRSHGEGSLFQRSSDGVWVGRLDLGYVDGKRIRKSVYGKTEREARHKLNELRRQHERGMPVVTKRQRLAGYLEHWLVDVLPGTVKESTQASYVDMVRRHIVPVLGHIYLDKLAPADVRRFLNRKAAEKSARGRPFSARTVQYLHAILRRALEHACREELLGRNVARLVSPRQVEREEVDPWTLEETQQFLKTAQRDRLYPLYVLALMLGLRRGELLALRWSLIDLDEGVLRVRESLQRIDGQLRFTSPKTMRSRRTVPLPTLCIAVLRAHHQAQRRERAQERAWPSPNLVFTTRRGTPIEPRNLNRHFERLCKQAGVRRIRFHEMRHTCASMLFAAGNEPRVIMDILGHSVVGTTLNLYTHVMPAQHRSAAESMDALFTGPGDDEEQEEDEKQ